MRQRSAGGGEKGFSSSSSDNYINQASKRAASQRRWRGEGGRRRDDRRAHRGQGQGRTIAFLNGTAEKQRGTFSLPGPRFPGFCSFVPSAAAGRRRRRRAPAAGWCDRPMAHGPWMGLWCVQVSRRSGRRARARSRTSRGWGPSVRPSQLRGSPPPQSGSGRLTSSSSSFLTQPRRPFAQALRRAHHRVPSSLPRRGRSAQPVGRP